MRPVPSPQDALDRLVRLIHRHLTDDLRRSPWRGSADPLAGHCFVASEAIYYLLGGRAAGWKPLSMRHEGAPHWLLRHEPSGRVVDATEWQFRTPPDVACAVGKGFMSSRPDTPSARAQELMRRVQADPDSPRAIVAAFASLSAPERRSNPAGVARVVSARFYPAKPDYGTPEAEEVRAVAHGLRGPDESAVRAAALALAPLVPSNVTLIPVPSSDGSTTANRRLARAIAELTSSSVRDGLVRDPGESQWRRRRDGRPSQGPEDMAVRWRGDPALGEPWLVDNVISTGATAEAAARALGRSAVVLVWADARRLHEPAMRPNPARVPAVVFHGTPHAFDELRPSDTGLFWFALNREVAERFSVHRAYVPVGNAAVWETWLAERARIVDLADLTDPDVRALKENYSSTAYAARYGAKLSDADWVRHYATFATLEGERGIVQFLRARRIDGAVVDDNLKGEPFRSLAIWNRRAIGPSSRVALSAAERAGAVDRLRPRRAT